MVNVVYLHHLKSYVVKRDGRFFTVHIDMERFNAREPEFGYDFLTCSGIFEFVRGRTTFIPMIKLLTKKEDGTQVSDGFLYKLRVSEEWLNKMISNSLVKLLEIIDISPIYYSNLWKFEDEIIVSAGIDNNLSVTSFRDDGKKTSEGFVSFENCRMPQNFKCFDNVVTIDRDGKDLKILVNGHIVDEARMTTSSIYDNKYLDFK